ncbi:hypothetical protein NGC36_22850 [Serratia rubidaea]|uniref:hypothetical protein n=1 Tax=Serratia rubidaea TaxID=61652 RepID=UPI002DBFAF33|nr:hypothetical protein [Serratia rubidaea]MEB7588110.1 hypothetical protein [Serratia rubidaea]
MTKSVIKSVKFSKEQDGKIPVTLLVDDVSLANEIYKECRDRFNVEVEIDDDILKAFNKNESTTQQRVIEKAKSIKSKQEK